MRLHQNSLLLCARCGAVDTCVGTLTTLSIGNHLAQIELTDMETPRCHDDKAGSNPEVLHPCELKWTVASEDDEREGFRIGEA